MPTSVKDLQQAQDAPVADVQPTKQASCTYRHLSGAYLLKAVFSAEPAAYVVDINGKALDGKQVSVSWTYDACHPLMALGRAVVEFRDRYPCVTIDYLGIRQRVIKNH